MRLTIALALVMLSEAAHPFPSGRPAVSLDGAWSFRHAPDDRGDAQRWYEGTAWDRTLRVPGCWEAQGVGAGTDRMHSHAVGVGWYRRTFTPPAAAAGSRAWLVFGGVHRSARVWVNGRLAGEHWGYPIAFRLDVTELLNGAGRQELVVAVDSRRHRDRDPLTGAFDVIDYMDVDWGGIFGHVTLETTGPAWLDDVFVIPDPAHARAEIRAEVAGRTIPGLRLRCSVTEWGAEGRGALASAASAVRNGSSGMTLALPRAPLWTPDAPRLLVATVTLVGPSGPVDRRTVRFGLRRLEVRGGEFLLNGDRFFLRGYGDDWTFPATVMGPSSVAEWRAYLGVRRTFGFNGVRHHSTMPPDDYLDAADEVGILVQPELPIAYAPFYAAATPAGHDLYRKVWHGYIRQMRNHPSVFAWCMGNEMWDGFPHGPELYGAARELDQTRPVIDTDGVPVTAARPTLDYLSVQFDEWSIPWAGRRDKYRVPTGVARPVIVHEMGNLSVLPDPADVAGYRSGIRPYWLEQMAAAVKSREVEGNLPRMLDASRRLQASLLKLNIEAARMDPRIKGHHQWLFRDYWSQSTGFVDQFDRVRGVTPEVSRRFIGPAVLLWERDRVSYRSGDVVPVRMYLSDYRPSAAPPLRDVTVRCSGTSVALRRPAGVGRRGVIGPWTGSLRMPVTEAPMEASVTSRCGAVSNMWTVWLFPRSSAAATPAGLIAARRLTREVVDRLSDGARVFVTDDRTVFPTLNGRFKPAWWHGDDAADHCYGNMISSHAAVRGFPAAGHGDLQMAGMMENRPVVLLDEVPGRIDPIVWSLDVPWRMARKAYLFEARVGAGRLLVSTLDLSTARRAQDPAAAWLRQRLLTYAASADFEPSARLSVEWLRARTGAAAMPDPATWLEGFATVVDNVEPAQRWHTHREDMVSTYPVRQTDGRQHVSWRTAAVPRAWAHKEATFVWAGGIGWATEPEAGPFRLDLDGRTLLDFPFTVSSGVWRSPDGRSVLRYDVRRTLPPDSFGVFALTVPADLLKPGAPAQLRVSAGRGGSKRWFSLAPYRDVAREEAEP